MIIKAGTVLTLEQGAYSDFGYDGPFTALRDFDQRTVCEEFTEFSGGKEKMARNYSGQTQFVAWLAKEGYVEDSNVSYKWYLGYTNFNPEIAE